MAKTKVQFEKGEWVVHKHHGIGQIESIDTKPIGGETSKYYKVKLKDFTLWVPMDNTEEDVLRALYEPDDFGRALEIVQQPPKKMGRNLRQRKGRISRVRKKHTPEDVAKLIRDLWGRRRGTKSFSQAERKALTHFTYCFVEEWARTMDISRQDAHSQLNDWLAEHAETDPK